MYQDIAYPYKVEDICDSSAISLDEIKSYLKLNENNPVIDSELILMCKTATDYAEKYSRQLFTLKKVTTKRCYWGEYRNGTFNEVFTLRRSPLISVTCIRCNDVELDENKYQVVTLDGQYGKIVLSDDLPDIDGSYPIEIEFVAGYEEIPNDIKLAILQHIASMWLNRGDCDDDTYNKCPKISKDIYKKYKIMEVGS